MIEPIAQTSVIPEERSTKQRHYAFCCNPQCAENGQEFHFEVVHSQFCCPKCGANQPPVVGMLCKTHLLIRDKTGPLKGVGGLRYYVVCDPKRVRLSTTTNHEAFTDDRSVCNCLDCLAKSNQAFSDANRGVSIN